ncbi:MAG: DUF6288 domain-containing protein [Phycisphaerae bacterium]|nr:DUF6288 domain-containing protein [Phycisphaerae bacterium]
MKKSVFCNSLLTLSIIAVFYVTVCQGASKLPENKPLQDLTKVILEDTKDTYYLGPIGARGWIQKISTLATPDDYEGFFSNDIARQILITAVEKGSPADGVLEVGDVILGTGKTHFSSNARKAIADAIDDAEKEKNKGILRLLRWRPDSPDKEDATVRSAGKRMWVKLQLKVIGTYSNTAPCNCPKSEAIIKQTAEVIFKNNETDRLHIAALGLLATGEEKYIAAVKDYIYKKGIADPKLKLTVETARSSVSWSWSYTAILLSEYYLLTGDKYVLPAIEEYAVNIARGISIGGNWGHKMADYKYNDGKPHGRLTGYGALNQPGITCFMAMNFAVKCGIKHPELTYAIDRASDFFGYFAQKGAIPYGHDHPLEYMLTNNGKCGSAAIAFALKKDTSRAQFFSRLCAAAHKKTEVGHTGTFFNTFWTPLGVNLSGPDTSAEFFKEHRWIHTLARRWNGGFVYQPPGGRFGGSRDNYSGLSSSAAFLMFYAAPRKKLYITGKEADESIWLTGQKAKAAVKAGLIDYKNMTDKPLLKLLAHPVPMVRRQAADDLGMREGDFLKPLRAMLKKGNYNGKVGACHGLAALKEKAAPAMDDLVAVIRNPKENLWVRNRAVYALSSIGKPAQKAIPALLKESLKDKPEDARGDLDKEIAITLSKIIEDPCRIELDKDLFYAAVKKFLDHPHHVTRAAAMNLIRNIPLEDIYVMADALIDVIMCNNTNYETYHNDKDRAMGLDILERLNISDGIDICIKTIETNKWGQKWRVSGENGRMATLVRYRANAKRVLPQLKAMRNGKSPLGRLGANVDEFLIAIEQSTETRKLISLEEAKRIGRERTKK